MTTQFQYETSAADQTAKLVRYAGESIVARRFVWFAYFSICGLSWLSAVLFYVKQGHQSLGYLAYGAFAAILTLALPRLYRWYQDSFWASVLTAASLQGIIGLTTLTLSEDMIEEVAPMTTTRAAWRDVLRIEHNQGRTFVFLAPLIAVVVPDGAFPDEAARAGFEQDIQQRIQANRPSDA